MANTSDDAAKRAAGKGTSGKKSPDATSAKDRVEAAAEETTKRADGAAKDAEKGAEKAAKQAEKAETDAATSAKDAATSVSSKAGDTTDALADDLEKAKAEIAETNAKIRQAREELSADSATQPAPAGRDAYGAASAGAASYSSDQSFAYAPPISDRPRRFPGESSLGRVFAAEFFGAFVLVLAGLGIGMYNAVMLTIQTQTGTGPYNAGTGLGGLAVALGFGLGVTVAAYAFGWISGGHFNPAVTLGAALAQRVRWARVPFYWLAQLVGSFAAAGLLWVISRTLTFSADISAVSSPAAIKETRTNIFASVANGFGEYSTGSTYLRFPMTTALLAEVIVTLIFVLVILGSTSKKANNKFAPLAIGLTLAVGLMILMPITNGSMNPTRSLAANAFAGWDHFKQVWVFVVGPLVGGALGGLLYPLFAGFGSRNGELEDAEA